MDLASPSFPHLPGDQFRERAVGRPETDPARRGAMEQLGHGLSAVGKDVEALSVQEAELSMERRLGTIQGKMLAMQSNLAMTYSALGRAEEALSMRKDVYSGYLNLFGKEHAHTLVAANNYASTLNNLQRFREAKRLFRKMIPVARRFVGDSNDNTLRLRWNYARALYEDDDATLDDLREAVATLEDIERTARRVFGNGHPLTVDIEDELRHARAALRTRETPPARSV